VSYDVAHDRFPSVTWLYLADTEGRQSHYSGFLKDSRENQNPLHQLQYMLRMAAMRC
jgi:hypothetical protein